MLQRAEEKRAMQRMVIAGGGGESASANAGDETTTAFMRPIGDQSKMSQSEMVSLLLDDEELAKR